MILLDTNLWIDHLDRPSPTIVRLLEDSDVVTHPFVIGEIALGTLRDRAVVVALDELPRCRIAFDAEVLMFIERHRLAGSGIGYVDAHLLMSARLTEDVRLWTRDKRLHAQAERLGVAYHSTDR